MEIWNGIWKKILGMEWNMEWKIFSMEWKWNGKQLPVRNVKNRLPFHSMPCFVGLR